MSDHKTVELRLRAAVESSPSGLLMIDSLGVMVLVNREVERLFGYSREELLGKPVELLVPERYRSKHPALRGTFQHAPSVRSMGAGRDLYGLRKDGTEFPVEIGLTPVATEEGMYVISSIVDISARQRAEQRFRIAVESSPNGMVMVDAAGTILLVNQEVERLFGYTRAELLGQSIDSLVPEPLRARHPEFRHQFFADPRARKMGVGRELFGLHKDGRQVPVEIGLNPIETDEGLFVLSSIVDISARRHAESERRKLEDQLRQAQKLEAVGRLAGGVAHDFNNILGMIVGYGELARDACADAAQAQDLDDLLAAARRGKGIVERILRFSRRSELVRQPLDLAQTLSEAVRMMRATLPAAVRIAADFADPLPRVLADATSMHQVLMNLATNAAHAMPDGGTISVRLQPMYVRDHFARQHPSLREGPHVLLAVRDTGIGMDPATCAQAMDPFFTTKPPGDGSGLGLPIVHGILRDHEGTMWLESSVGAGTTVHCLLPAVQAEAPVIGVSVAPRGAGQRVLLVDDEVALAHVGQRRLRALGYEPTGFSDPEEALEAFRAAPGSFDAVVTDLSMPKMSGLQLARSITTIAPVPVLLLTGYTEDLTPELLAEAGVTEVVLKPVDQSELATVMRRMLDSLSKPLG